MRLRFRLKNDVVNRVTLLCSAAKDDQTKNAVASHVRKGIIERTTKDEVDADGASFKAYSTSPTYISKLHRPAPRGGIKTPQTKGKVTAYNKKRKGDSFLARRSQMTKLTRDAGRGGKSVYYPNGYGEFKVATIGGGVNLYGTHSMLNALVWRLTMKGCIFYFATALQNAKAYAHINGDGVPERNFLGWGKVAGETESTVELIRRNVNAIAGIKP